MAPPAPARITYATREHTDDEIAAILEPEVRSWFDSRFDSFTPPQRYAVKEVHDGVNTLISSPTGSGKTLSAFLAAINELAALAKRGELEDRVYVVYVSPLKALNNDIERNLEGPLEGIRAEFEAAGLDPPDIRVGVRTGDTTSYERQKMTREPPHIFITTPESLAIVLNAPKFSEHLTGVRWVIVDEVHALAGDKRGTHLSLSLERLSRLAEQDPVRVGLSATCHPLDRVAGFLVGGSETARRPVTIVDVDYLKQTQLDVLLPVADPLRASEGEHQQGLYACLDEVIRDHRTTLIFTNSRAGTERVVHQLKERFPDEYGDVVGAHHGSMSKQRRERVEQRLKDGELRAVVTSTSLELGIDIGYVDCVVMLSSPKGIGRALQRVGRSGHRLHAISRGLFVAQDPDDLIECAVIAKRAGDHRLDEVRVPEGCLDVLCQHLIGIALERTWDTYELLDVVRRAWPFRDLSIHELRACLRYLDGHPELEDRYVYGKLHYDEESETVRGRGGSVRVLYFMNVGTIPDTTMATVKIGDEYVGEIEEGFLEGLKRGDVFVLGGAQYEFRYAAGTKVHVRRAGGRRVTVPFWFSESLPMSPELAGAIHDVRARVAAVLHDEGRDAAVAWTASELDLAQDAARVVVDHVHAQARFSHVPAVDEVLVEEYRSELDDKLVYAVHTPLGRRANDALARAFARRLSRAKGCKVEGVATDTAIALVLPPTKTLAESDVRGLFHLDLDRALMDAIERSEFFNRRFRHVATRAFMVLRRTMRRESSVGRQQVNARRLVARLRGIDPNHPVLKETYREIREDAMDVATAEAFCFDVVTRARRVHLVRGLPGPSPFALNLAAVASGGGSLAQRRERVREMAGVVDAVLSEPSDDDIAPTCPI